MTRRGVPNPLDLSLAGEGAMPVNSGLVRLAAAGLAALLLAAGGTSEPGRNEATAPGREPPPEALDRARKAADALTKDLMRTLLRELGEGGPLQAVRVCSEVAQTRVAAHSVDGLSVRRVSLKVRNPADVPDDYERRVLEQLASRHRQGDLPAEVAEVVDEDGLRRLRYLRPIVIGPPCLKCHGDPRTMDPPVRKMIELRYPEDRAVGYQQGDLRGAVSISVKLN
jgi:hypothetical protein